jgi:predicted PurR-regulated permease PerM
MTSRLPVPALSDRLPRAQFDLLRTSTLVGITLIGLIVCYLVALPFLPALIWALAAAVLAMPLHRRFEAKLRHPNLAASISLALLAVLVFFPLALLGNALFAALIGGLGSMQEQVAGGDLQRLVESHPLARWLASLAPADVDLTSIFGNVTGWVAGVGASVVRGSVTNIITIVLTFYLVFFFLRDHREALHQVRMLAPLSRSETDYLFERVADTIHAIILGTVITSAIQGVLGGAMFWLLGLPNPVFWGIVMAVLAIIPVLGTFIVWIPAAVYLALGGEWGKAAVLVTWGTFVIGGIDNILYPILAGGRLRLHTLPTFIAIVGGLALFGTSGLLLGPLAVVLTIALLKIWHERAVAAGDATRLAETVAPVKTGTAPGRSASRLRPDRN